MCYSVGNKSWNKLSGHSLQKIPPNMPSSFSSSIPAYCSQLSQSLQHYPEVGILIGIYDSVWFTFGFLQVGSLARSSVAFSVNEYATY